MAKHGKYYVVFAGHHTGVFESWDECREFVDGYPGAKYRSYGTLLEAVNAYRGNPDADMDIIRAIAEHHNLPQEMQLPLYGQEAPAPTPAPALARKPATGMALQQLLERFPQIVRDAIAVDAGCSKNPGPVEYQGVYVATGQRLFHQGPFAGGTNNIGEYLGIVHAAAFLEQRGNSTTAIYTDSRTALSWIRNRHDRSTLKATASNAQIRALLDRANAWMATHLIRNPIYKWDTDAWGEIPADFGRK